jgi:hypothetical protein
VAVGLRTLERRDARPGSPALGTVIEHVIRSGHMGRRRVGDAASRKCMQPQPFDGLFGSKSDMPKCPQAGRLSGTVSGVASASRKE